MRKASEIMEAVVPDIETQKGYMGVVISTSDLRRLILDNIQELSIPELHPHEGNVPGELPDKCVNCAKIQVLMDTFDITNQEIIDEVTIRLKDENPILKDEVKEVDEIVKDKVI